jgi:3-phosphoglycerate kinase
LEEAENAAAGLQPGQVLLLNLRFHSEEEAGMLLLQNNSGTRRYLCK